MCHEKRRDTDGEETFNTLLLASFSSFLRLIVLIPQVLFARDI
jgi:hypothetical protein